MVEEVGFVADQQGMLFLVLVQTHDGFGDLPYQITAAASRFEVQFTRQLPQKIRARSETPVQVEDLVQAGVEGSGEGAGGGGFSGSDFAGQQTGGVMIHEELQSGVDLIPGLRREQLLAIRVITERRFLKTEESFPHNSSSLLVPVWPSVLLQQFYEVDAGGFWSRG